MNNNLGQIIQHRRKSLNMTQEQLAAKIDRSSGLIGQIERGETTPSFETLRRLKTVLLFDINDVYDGSIGQCQVSTDLSQMISKWNKNKQDFILEIARLVEEHFPEEEVFSDETSNM